MKRSIEPTAGERHHSAIARAREELEPLFQAHDWMADYYNVHAKRLAHDLAVLEARVPKDSHIVEFGSNPPVLTRAIAGSGWKITGLDLQATQIAEAMGPDFVDVRQCNIETDDYPVEPGSADVVLFNEVFEHLRLNPIETMTRVLKVLKPGGSLHLSTPNLRSLRGIHNLVMRDRSGWCLPDIYENYRYVETYGFMGHVREYTVSDVSDFLQKVGFEIEGVMYRGGGNTRYGRIVYSLSDRMRPFFSLFAKRPAA